MPRFFIEETPSGGYITLTGEDAHHLVKVLRMKPGESLTVCDSAGHDYLCTLEEAAKGAAVCRVHGATASVGEPETRVTLYMRQWSWERPKLCPSSPPGACPVQTGKPCKKNANDGAKSRARQRCSAGEG